jgi:molecular chaperone Hsp33
MGLSTIGAALDAGRVLVYEAVATESVRVQWSCRCSRERVESMLRSLGPAELRAMLEEDAGAEVVCHYCSKKFRFDESALALLIPVNPEGMA